MKKKTNQSLSNSTLIAPLYSINYSSLVDFVEYSAIDGFWYKTTVFLKCIYSFFISVQRVVKLKPTHWKF